METTKARALLQARRWFLIAGAAAGLVFLLMVRGASEARGGSPHFQRTREQYLHERYVVGSIGSGIAAYLPMARDYGRVRHLDDLARHAQMVFPMTLATDPYTPSEIAHLEQARRAIDAYLAPQDRSAEALAGHFTHAEEALKALGKVMRSLDGKGDE